MSDKADNQPARYRTRRAIAISCLLLFLLGGLYWTLSPGTSTTTTSPSVSTPRIAPESPLANVAIDSVQHLPDASPAHTRVGTKHTVQSVSGQSVVQRQVTMARASVAKPVIDEAPLLPRPSLPAPVMEVQAKVVEDAPVKVAGPVVAASVENKPVARRAAVPSNGKFVARPRPMAASPVPTEFKPVVVRPVPVTASATPAIRKTKNDEDVEVDFK